MRAGVAQGGLVSLCAVQSACERHAHASSHVELALYADYTGSIPTSRSLLFLVWYRETCLNRLQHWQWDWTNGIRVSKSTAVLCARITRFLQRPRPLQFSREPIQGVETSRYLGVTLGTRLTLSTHVNLVWRKAPQSLRVLASLLNTRSGLFVKNGVCFASNSSVLWWTTHARSGGPLPTPTSRICMCCEPRVFARWITQLGTIATG
jgi:hypothetical protein